MFRTCMLTGLFVCASLSSALAAPVSQVTVELTATAGTIPPLVEKRIAASIQTVGNHVFLQQDDGDILRRQGEYNRQVYDIIDRVLIGYTVEHIQIVPGPETVLRVQIRPWGDTIRRLWLIAGLRPAAGRKRSRSRPGLH